MRARFPGVVWGVGMLWVASSALSSSTEASTEASTDVQRVVSPPSSSSNSSRVVTGPAVAGVYRSTGANGEVEFNNFGNGDPVALDVNPAPNGADIERSAARVRDMLDVAGVLAADRQERESARAARRAAVRQEKAALARQEARQEEWLAATQPRFYPGFLPRRGAGYGRRRGAGYGPDWRPVAGPYRDGYRYPEQPGSGNSNGADVVDRPVTRQRF